MYIRVCIRNGFSSCFMVCVFSPRPQHPSRAGKAEILCNRMLLEAFTPARIVSTYILICTMFLRADCLKSIHSVYCFVSIWTSMLDSNVVAQFGRRQIIFGAALEGPRNSKLAPSFWSHEKQKRLDNDLASRFG